MENCQGGSLGELIELNSQSQDPHSSFSDDDLPNDDLLRKCNSEDYFKKVMHKLLQSVKLLHDQGIAHRDLKIENVMLKSAHKPEDIRIIDFGLSQSFKRGEKFKTQVGTAHY